VDPLLANERSAGEVELRMLHSCNLDDRGKLTREQAREASHADRSGPAEPAAETVT